MMCEIEVIELNPKIDTEKVPEYVWDSLTIPLISIVTAFYQDPKNQAAYEQWHLEKYGCYPKETSYEKNKII